MVSGFCEQEDSQRKEHNHISAAGGQNSHEQNCSWSANQRGSQTDDVTLERQHDKNWISALLYIHN